MVAKTMKGLEAVLADELRNMGALNVQPGHRMVSFEGNIETLYRANLCLRTALRILKPFYSFTANNPDTLYDRLKEFDWNSVMTPDSTFAIDMVMFSDTFTHSRFATYRVKDAIVDWFRDRYDRRPNVRLNDADVMINVHIQGDQVTLSLDSSGESLHKRGWRVATTEAPINEVLAAGILLIAGYDGSQPLVDPMCGSGTFLVEAALIAANINPGVFRRKYAFQNWPDYDEQLFESLWDNDSAEREPQNIIMGADMLRSAVDATQRNLRAAGVSKYVSVEVRKLSEWKEAPAQQGIIVTNPPYGTRISAPDMEELYALIGRQLKNLFTGWNAWIISLKDEYFHSIGLATSEKISLLNGSLECELREYVMFAGNKKEFRASGGRLKKEKNDTPRSAKTAANRNAALKRIREDGKKNGSPEKKKSEKPFGRANKRLNSKPESDLSEKPFRRRTEETTPISMTAADSENPLAARRNVNALKSILNREPSLPKSDGPIMRSRGWKKKS